MQHCRGTQFSEHSTLSLYRTTIASLAWDTCQAGTGKLGLGVCKTQSTACAALFCSTNVTDINSNGQCNFMVKGQHMHVDVLMPRPARVTGHYDTLLLRGLSLVWRSKDLKCP